jgi:hypothetical protein
MVQDHEIPNRSRCKGNGDRFRLGTSEGMRSGRFVGPIDLEIAPWLRDVPREDLLEVARVAEACAQSFNAGTQPVKEVLFSMQGAIVVVSAVDDEGESALSAGLKLGKGKLIAAAKRCVVWTLPRRWPWWEGPRVLVCLHCAHDGHRHRRDGDAHSIPLREFSELLATMN